MGCHRVCLHKSFALALLDFWKFFKNKPGGGSAIGCCGATVGALKTDGFLFLIGAADTG